MMEGMVQPLIALVQVVMIDVALAGDNAIVVGIAASRVAEIRQRASCGSL
jgi:predicted tellurium resistance membrane protein TerC